jgi:hypothetical protein
MNKNLRWKEDLILLKSQELHFGRKGHLNDDKGCGFRLSKYTVTVLQCILHGALMELSAQHPK